jgi:hypothetical protein
MRSRAETQAFGVVPKVVRNSVTKAAGWANVWLTLLRKLGMNLDRIGGSTGEAAI